MKSIRAALLVGLCVGSSGCYDFDFPLDPTPEVSIDVRLVGAWRCLGVRADADEPAFVLRITPRTDKIADWALESTMADGSKETEHLDVHGSTVKGGDLLNVLEKGEKANGKWNIVQYSFLLPDVLRLQAVDDTSFEKAKTSSAALRKAIENRRGDPSIYNAFAVCVRAKVSPPEAVPTSSPKD
ncbi:MAG: hypothetical protein ABI672_07770 [Vicinamibacteria bacterium]